MIYNYSISTEKKIVHIVAEGNYSISEIKNLVELVTNDEKYIPYFNSIVDIQKVKYIPVVSEMMEISDFFVIMKNSFKAKVALVVSGGLHYNLFKLSTNRSRKSGIKFEIFTDLEKAKNWIAES